MARTYQVGDVEVVLAKLELSNIYAQMIEGTPHLVRMFHIHRLDNALAEKPRGLYVCGLAAMRADLAARSDEALPPERVTATLASRWCPVGETRGNTFLEVIWYQAEGIDPFHALVDIVRDLDWSELSDFVPWE
jgi:hypothetical protein